VVGLGLDGYEGDVADELACGLFGVAVLGPAGAGRFGGRWGFGQVGRGG